MFERIRIDPSICHGKPVIEGTRILVSTLLGALAGGDSVDDLLADYPGLMREDVLAALRFASELSQFEDLPYEASAS